MAQMRATGSVWLDLFGGPQGAVIYPQYSWSAKTSICQFGGYGFFEIAPHEPAFTNHLVWCAPRGIPWFSVHTETGGIPRESLGFFQVAPRINIHEAVPILKNTFSYFNVAILPRFIGIRPNNMLIAGGTKKFGIVLGMKASVNGFRRFFAGSRPDYGEYWFVIYPSKISHLGLGVFLLQSGSRTSVSAGIRIYQ